MELAGGRLAASLRAGGLLVPSCGRRGWRWALRAPCGVLGPMGLDGGGRMPRVGSGAGETEVRQLQGAMGEGMCSRWGAVRQS